jgi:hypothetical protein
MKFECPTRYKKLYEDTLEKLDATEQSRQACEHQFGLHMQTCVQERIFDKSHWTEPMVVDGGFMTTALENGLKYFDADNVWNIPLDGKYWLASDEEIIEYILYSMVNRLLYILHRFDCNAFAWVFRGDYKRDTLSGNCLWVCDWSGGHSYDLFVRRNGGLWWYEAQQSRWWTTEEHKYEGMYAMERAVILG